MLTLGAPCVNILLAVGADYFEGPPVPIPNTVVKLKCAENTWRAAFWKIGDADILNRLLM